MAKAIEFNQILGSRYIIMASEPSGTNGLDGWTKLCAQLTAASEQLKPQGLAAGFHNHQVEWAMFDSSMRFMDFIAANTPKDLCYNWTSAPAWSRRGSRRLDQSESRPHQNRAPQGLGTGQKPKKKVIAFFSAKAYRPGKKSLRPLNPWAAWNFI